MKHLHQNTVLVLNKNWLAINTTTPADAMTHLVAGTVRGLDISEENGMMPYSWEDWQYLPVREQDQAIHSASLTIRVPTVIITTHYSNVPLKSLQFGFRGLWERDEGRCQYTGRKLRPSEANIDHIIPQSRGGATEWENCVLSDRYVNQRKADRTPHEAGLQLLKKPTRPKAIPVTYLIKNPLKIIDWDHFLPC